MIQCKNYINIKWSNQQKPYASLQFQRYFKTKFIKVINTYAFKNKKFPKYFCFFIKNLPHL